MGHTSNEEYECGACSLDGGKHVLHRLAKATESP